MNKMEDAGKQLREENIKKVISTICMFITAVIVGLIMNKYMFQMAKVTGSSMEGTLYDGDFLYTSKLTSNILGVKRGNVVVIDELEGITDSLLVKRVIGVPGDHIQIKGQDVFINGNKIEEDYTIGKEDLSYFDIDYKIKDDEYFVIGDNRGLVKSYDSRHFGPIKRSDIISVVRFKLRFNK